MSGSACVPTSEQREAVLRELVRDYAAESNGLRKLLGVVGRGREDLESEMLAMVESAITRALEDWAPDGREARVAKRVKTELRLEIRRHFGG